MDRVTDIANDLADVLGNTPQGVPPELAEAETCTCRGYDPADPAMHGDTSQGCPEHDQSVTGDDARAEYLDLLIDVTDRAVETNAWTMDPLDAARVNRQLNDAIAPAYDLHPDYPTRPY